MTSSQSHIQNIVDEHTPLLSDGLPREESATREQSAVGGGDVKSEVWLLVKFAVPTYFTLLLEMSLFSTTVICVGHIGTNELAAASIATMTANVIAYSWTQGMVCALDTLCSQAWTANPKTTSLHPQRMAVILGMMLVPQFFLFWNAAPILRFLRQDPAVVVLASAYLKTLSFSLPAYGGFECIRRWLQAQGLMHVPTILVGVVAPINIIINYLLVWSPAPLGMGFMGAPLAAAISTNLMFLGAVIYCVFFGPREGWGGWSSDAFTDLGDCLRLGLAGVAMTASEWWAFEVLGLACSWLGPTALAANSVVGNAQFIFYQPALAISIACSVRLGNLLGANAPAQARMVARIGLSVGFCIGAVNMVVLSLNKNWIGKIFTSAPDVLELVKQVMPLVAVYQLADSTAGAAYGIMRGTGQASQAALVTAVSYWVVGIPFSLTSMYKFGLGLFGLWLGVTVGLIFVSIGLSIYIGNYLDFEREAKKAQERSGSPPAH
ncbi:MATE efflux family protein [Meredithblackwellia eburnea MCA 4105]